MTFFDESLPFYKLHAPSDALREASFARHLLRHVKFHYTHASSHEFF